MPESAILPHGCSAVIRRHENLMACPAVYPTAIWLPRRPRLYSRLRRLKLSSFIHIEQTLLVSWSFTYIHFHWNDMTRNHHTVSDFRHDWAPEIFRPTVKQLHGIFTMCIILLLAIGLVMNDDISRILSLMSSMSTWAISYLCTGLHEEPGESIVNIAMQMRNSYAHSYHRYRELLCRSPYVPIFALQQVNIIRRGCWPTIYAVGSIFISGMVIYVARNVHMIFSSQIESTTAILSMLI